jgi:hypothetical protein
VTAAAGHQSPYTFHPAFFEFPFPREVEEPLLASQVKMQKRGPLQI